jgi:ElaB/YqjD/DUF883 family membrane-anchored ribosome-binding protein
VTLTSVASTLLNSGCNCATVSSRWPESMWNGRPGRSSAAHYVQNADLREVDEVEDFARQPGGVHRLGICRRAPRGTLPQEFATAQRRADEEDAGRPYLDREIPRLWPWKRAVRSRRPNLAGAATMITPNEFQRAVSMSEDPELSTTAIRAEIDRTRERLGETVEALGAQLNPSHLKQRVKDSVREATIGKVQQMAHKTRERINETGRGLAQTIRDNPLPAAMAAAGIGWLLLSSRDQGARGRFGNGKPDGPAIADDSFETSGITAGLRNVAEDVSGMAHGLTQKAQDPTQRVVEKAKETGDRVVDRADAARQRLTEQARTTARRVEHRYEENPMGLGAMALALGLAIGLAVPATRKEAALIGDARDKLMDKAREQVAETTGKVENIVERAIPEVQSVVRDAAREEGLTG